MQLAHLPVKQSQARYDCLVLKIGVLSHGASQFAGKSLDVRSPGQPASNLTHSPLQHSLDGSPTELAGRLRQQMRPSKMTRTGSAA
jgi:hypothetical protein